MDLHTRLRTLTADLEHQRTQLVEYCTSKMRAHDWHAVQDAGSDIRELDAQLDLIADLAGESFTDE